MRRRQARIDRLAHAVHDVCLDTADGEAAQRLDANTARDTTPASYIASLEALKAGALHEARHAWCAEQSDFTVTSLALRNDATGCCTISGSGHGYSTELDKIVFALVGPADDFEIAASFDIIIARIKIDNLNARRIGPPISFVQAARLAVDFVNDHRQAITNIAIALLDARELDHFAVEVFGRCGP